MREKMTTMSEMFPYAVPDNCGVDYTALDKMDLIHLTDYIYWKRNMRFKDAENATMYKLMQGT
jgi:hypothetical protein